jgi:hypothetical protein
MSLDFTLKKMVLSEIYSDNITHNLIHMAMDADLYYPLWRPEEIGITHAHQMIPRLETGLALLRSDPERFEKWNPVNGWGNYVGLVVFVRDLLEACKNDPDAEVSACR